MNAISRRRWLQAASVGALGAASCAWLPALASEVAPLASRERRHCVLLWMTGGPSQIDTFDLKPGHKNGGEFKEISTAAPGLRWSEHLPKLAAHANHLAVVRSVSTKEGDHGRGTYLMRTGHLPMGPILYPTIGSSLAKHLGSPDDDLPSYVAIAPYRAFNAQAFAPGFLGPKYAPLTVAASDVFQAAPMNPAAANDYARLAVDDLGGGDAARLAGRRELWQSLQSGFIGQHPGSAAIAHDTVYQRALKLMSSSAAAAFDLEQEPARVREAYGKGRFGQGCLMARRLIERGVPFVEVTLGSLGNGTFGWDTHQNNFRAVKSLSEELDAGWSTLITDLKQRGLLEHTTFLWMGEFGRTPNINQGAGRDHFPGAWSVVFGGAGIRGGQAYGKTSEDGMTVAEGPVEVGDVLSTLCSALKLPTEATNLSEMGRPIKLAEGKPIAEILS